MVKVLFICFAAVLFSAADKIPFWINIHDCPMEIGEDRDYILVSNKSPRDVVEFQLGCVRLNNVGGWEIGKVVEKVRGPIEALNGAYMTTSDTMLDLHYQCGARYWRLGVTRVLFDKGMAWDLKQQQKRSNKMKSGTLP